MSLFYKSGEEIKTGDCVLLHGEAGYIELLADPAIDADDWLVREKGGGVMIVEPKVFGRLFQRPCQLRGPLFEIQKRNCSVVRCRLCR